MKYHSFVILASIVLLVSNKAHAAGKWTSEQAAMNNIVSAMRLFVDINHGAFPTNWFEVNSVIDLNQLNEQVLAKSSVFPLQEHYSFVFQEIPFLNSDEKVFLIRTSPVENSEKILGRHLIALNEGGLSYRWLPEEKVQQMLAKAGVTELPKPEPWPPTTNAAAQSPPAQPSNAVEPESPLPRDKTLPSDLQSPQNTNPASEIVAVTPVTTTKSWWPVFIIAGIGVIFLLALRQRQRKQ